MGLKEIVGIVDFRDLWDHLDHLEQVVIEENVEEMACEVLQDSQGLLEAEALRVPLVYQAVKEKREKEDQLVLWAPEVRQATMVLWDKMEETELKENGENLEEMGPLDLQVHQGQLDPEVYQVEMVQQAKQGTLGREDPLVIEVILVHVAHVETQALQGCLGQKATLVLLALRGKQVYQANKEKME